MDATRCSNTASRLRSTGGDQEPRAMKRGTLGTSWEDKLNDLPTPRGVETLGFFPVVGRWEDTFFSQKVEDNKNGHTPLVYKSARRGEASSHRPKSQKCRHLQPLIY